jgi:hypothetical protein
MAMRRVGCAIPDAAYAMSIVASTKRAFDQLIPRKTTRWPSETGPIVDAPLHPVVRSELDCMVGPKAWSDMPLGTPLVEALDQLDRFAKEVMPGFRGAKVAAAAE